MFKWKALTFILIVAMIGIIGYVARTQLFQISPLLLRKFGYSSFQIRITDVEFLSGNLQLRGTLYAPTMSFGKYPGILICHGGTKLGRKLALYAIMARKLAEQGYVVLTFDFRGFGESEDPHKFETFSSLDFVQDVSSALNDLSRLRQVDTSKLYVIGHSFGAGVGVMAGIRDSRVKKVVSISPGRCTEERFFGENAVEPEYPSIRMSYDMKIHPPIPKEIFNPHLKDYAAEVILDYPVHPPILLVDGEQESQKELGFLKAVYDQMTEPKNYVTIQEADHYFGTTRNQDGFSENVPYDKSVMAELVDAVEQWLRHDT